MRCYEVRTVSTLLFGAGSLMAKGSPACGQAGNTRLEQESMPAECSEHVRGMGCPDVADSGERRAGGLQGAASTGPLLACVQHWAVQLEPRARLDVVMGCVSSAAILVMVCSAAGQLDRQKSGWALGENALRISNQRTYGAAECCATTVCAIKHDTWQSIRS